MAITKDYIELNSATLGGGTYKFKALLRQWSDALLRPKSLQFALTGDTMVTRSPTTSLHQLSGALMLKETPDAGYATIANLKSLFVQDDLTARGPEDGAAWDAELMTPYSPVTMDPRGNFRLFPFQIIERTT